MKFRPKKAPPVAREPHAYKVGRVDGIWECTQCPLPRKNRIHDPAVAAELEAERAAYAAEWAEFERARLGEREWADA